MSDLKELYREVILDHNKHPRNFRPMEGATNTVEGYNPLCGDHYTVYVKVAGNRIEDVCFEGAGCAISKASASVMSQAVKGKTIQETEGLFEEFHRMVIGESHGDDTMERMGRLAAFAGVSEFPARVKCASLAWHTLKAAIEGADRNVSTE